MAGKTLFDHIKAITNEQDPKYYEKLSEEDKKTWSNFMINRFLSMNPDWVDLIATILPLTQTLEPKDMYKLYINVIPKGRYFLKYMKGKSAEKYESFVVKYITLLLLFAFLNDLYMLKLTSDAASSNINTSQSL